MIRRHRDRFSRVATLVEGFETPFGLELLSTIHWVVVQERVATHEDVVRRVYEWGDRKKRFSKRQIVLALGVLQRNGWLPPVQATTSAV
jgi:hypothetical protein